jgi:hypothetical protein
MNWRRFIENKYSSNQSDKYVCIPRFYPPASKGKLKSLETSLGVSLPFSLKDLLYNSDGVMDLIELLDGNLIENKWLIWPTEEIAKGNKSLRTEPMKTTYQRSFDELLFFANAGVDGILFAFMVCPDKVHDPKIYVWHPIDNEVTEIASSLRAFVEQWIDGEITI